MVCEGGIKVAMAKHGCKHHCKKQDGRYLMWGNGLYEVFVSATHHRVVKVTAGELARDYRSKL